ncbi:MAG TPA: N-acetyltransferase [Patescibacteria group bacterium]|nr:N-acetyltransferase [Patescibacteria group bacterium]
MSSKLSLAFRKAAARDVPALAEVYAASFADKNEQTDLPGYLDWTVQNRDQRVIIAETPEHKIAGFVIAAFDSAIARNAVNVEQLAVAPECQGRGVGRALLEEVEATALKNDFSRVTLHVRVDNEKAKVLYESEGFRAAEAEPGFYMDGTAALPMTKELPPANLPVFHMPNFVRRWTSSYA